MSRFWRWIQPALMTVRERQMQVVIDQQRKTIHSLDSALQKSVRLNAKYAEILRGRSRS